MVGITKKAGGEDGETGRPHDKNQAESSNRSLLDLLRVRTGLNEKSLGHKLSLAIDA